MSDAYTSQKAETERWFFIGKWCRERGLSPMFADNFNRAAMEWAKTKGTKMTVEYIRRGAEYSPANTVWLDVEASLFYPNGGGRIHFVGDMTQFLEDFEPVTEEMRQRGTKWRRAWFILGDDTERRFQGYTDGTLWNGWAVPWFELGTAIQAREYIGDLGDDGLPDLTESGHDIMVAGQEIRVYDAGGMRLTWEEINVERLQLIIDVTVALNGVPVEGIETNLREAAHHLFSIGAITLDSAAEVDKWDVRVERMHLPR